MVPPDENKEVHRLREVHSKSIEITNEVRVFITVGGRANPRLWCHKVPVRVRSGKIETRLLLGGSPQKRKQKLPIFKVNHRFESFKSLREGISLLYFSLREKKERPYLFQGAPRL